MMARNMWTATVWALILATCSVSSAEEQKKPAPPKHQVYACYFHRTVRCPTCQTVGKYVKEAIVGGFKKEVEGKAVIFQEIDFQAKKNKKFTEHYKIAGPTLILMDVRQGKVAAWKPLPKVWSLVGKKDELTEHVQKEIKRYLKAPAPKKPAAPADGD